ncbi:helix-turn-helix domain-containing protein [Halobacillus litoralis]|uniref:Helix-turn-helix domain-containing protein n=1 Tax=Halobacillus litoralis TaxID=45668 RepID=A0A845DUA3_9BACI|nr:helix-turn-helix domain-containing protein [Halobacillus litoralis]MYL31016.1 helix-turn-helix domain-containing protein [Halobacillus halophilus]MYL36181.1 helix-turn-helix domain-containing protein [Halobacillus litoralis]
MENRLAELRKKRGWSQDRLAEKLHVSRQTIISIEKNRYSPSLPLAFEISRAFGVSIEDIFIYREGGE